VKRAVCAALLFTALSAQAGVRPPVPHWYVAHVTGKSGVIVDLGPFRKSVKAEQFCVEVRQRPGTKCEVVPLLSSREWKEGAK
jgi:hypothetical protein